MKKVIIKFIILTLISTMTLGIFASCGDILSIKHSNNAYAFYVENTKSNFDKDLTLSLKEMSSEYQGAIKEVKGDIAIAENYGSNGTKTIYIYNLSTGKNLYTTSDKNCIISVFGKGFTVKLNKTAYLYNAQGTLLFSSTTDEAMEQEVLRTDDGRYYRFDHCYFRATENGLLEKIDETLPDAVFSAQYFNDHYYCITDSEIMVFDKDCHLVASHELNYPLAKEINTFILSNGSVAIQTLEETVDEDIYDLALTSGSKRNLKTYLFNINGNYVSQVNCKFYIHSSLNIAHFNTMTNNIDEYVMPNAIIKNKDLMVISTISKDKTVNSSEYCIVDPEKLSMVTKASNVYELSRSIKCIAKDRFLAQINNNTYQILDENMNCLAYSSSGFYSTGKYIIDKGLGCIYDMNMELLFDFYHEGYTFNSMVGGNVLLEKEGVIYLYKGEEEPTRVGSNNLVTVEYRNLIVVSDTVLQTECKYYDSDINLLLTCDTGKIMWLSPDLDSDINVLKCIGYAVDIKGNYKNYELTIELK